jgi:mRNA interferase MazF
VSHRSYVPERGDIVHMNFSPSAGKEMADRHYAVVLTSLRYNKQSRTAIVCPITSRVRGWGWEVPVPAGLLPDKKGVGPVDSVVVADGVRHIDIKERELAFVTKAPKDFVEEVVDALFDAVEE